MLQEGNDPHNKQQMVGRLVVTQSRFNETRLSERKEALRKTQLFDEVDLKNLMLTNMKVGRWGILFYTWFELEDDWKGILKIVYILISFLSFGIPIFININSLIYICLYKIIKSFVKIC